MKKKAVDLDRVKRGLAELDKIAAEHPRLLGDSTPEEWEATLIRSLMRNAVFTVPEAAQLLNCHEQTIRREIRRGKLKAAKVGNDWRISRPDLETYWRSVGGHQLFPPDLEEPSTMDEEPEKKAKEWSLFDDDDGIETKR